MIPLIRTDIPRPARVSPLKFELIDTLAINPSTIATGYLLPQSPVVFRGNSLSLLIPIGNQHAFALSVDLKQVVLTSRKAFPPFPRNLLKPFLHSKADALPPELATVQVIPSERFGGINAIEHPIVGGLHFAASPKTLAVAVHDQNAPFFITAFLSAEVAPPAIHTCSEDDIRRIKEH